MTVQNRINEVSKTACDRAASTVIFWDDQDPENEGPAYRDGEDSGGLDHTGWSDSDGSGLNLLDYFGADGAYMGPDQDGVYPMFSV